MIIIERNFIRLLRLGAFGQNNGIEPMSEWKWRQFYQMTEALRVMPWMAEGVSKSRDDFFLKLPADLKETFAADHDLRINEVTEQSLANPLLNYKLQRLAEEAGPEDATFHLLLMLISIARHTMSQGVSVRQLIVLGIYLRTTHDNIEYEVLKVWIKRLRMQRIVRLVGRMLMHLFDFRPEEIPFADFKKNSNSQRETEKALHLAIRHAQRHATDEPSDEARQWSMKNALRYMHYYPSEAMVSFVVNFFRSLSHIEE